ncbi:MAG: spermidine/putrescine ABC transporter substrate-binding protein [Balneolales bacterium]|nr:spermidine/putrescine ABC transporter substrate-binding protein [Balneolales bacterium]
MKNKLISSPPFSITVIIILILLVVWYRNPEIFTNIKETYTATQNLTDRTDTLRVYSFPNYFTDEIITQFEERYNVEVVIDYYDSNEEMLARMQQGKKADVIVPTDYVVAFLAREGYLEPIDRSKLENYKFLDGRFQEMDYDYANQYSIPYFWGSVGIAYNQHYVMGLPLSWDTILNPEKIGHLRNRISILDDARMTLGISLISLGYSPNTKNEDEIALATQRLIDIIPYLRMINSENLEEDFRKDNIVIGMYWSGSSAKAANNIRNLRFILPSEGSIFFVDNLAIPINSTGKTLAFEFIDYLLDPKVAAQLTNKNFFANPVTHSRRYIDRLILKGPAYKNPFLSPNIHVIEDLGEATLLYLKYWDMFKDSAAVNMKHEIRIMRTEDRIQLQ